MLDTNLPIRLFLCAAVLLCFAICLRFDDTVSVYGKDESVDDDAVAIANEDAQHKHAKEDDCLSCHMYDITLPSVKELRAGECGACHSLSRIRGAVIDWTHVVRDSMLVGTRCVDCHDFDENGTTQSIEKNKDLCLNCHPEVAGEFRLASNHPFFEGLVECFDCHPAHATRKVPLTFDEMQFLGSFALANHDPIKQNAACLGCHSYFRLTSISGSGFVVANSMNLHEVHCERGFAACIECHTAHGSFLPKLIREKVDTGNYITFVRGEGWGTCSVICHSEPHVQTQYGADPEMLTAR